MKELEAAILERLRARAPSATICPSEVLPRALRHDKQEMEKVRQAAKSLVEQGLIDIVQRARVVDPRGFKGPIRLRLK